MENKINIKLIEWLTKYQTVKGFVETISTEVDMPVECIRQLVDARIDLLKNLGIIKSKVLN